MQLTGQILKENRENQHKTIEEVSVATKINPKLVIALEEGDLDSLPSKTFIRGFVRTYALYLKIDVEAVLSTYHEEMGSTLPRPNPSPTPSQEDPAARFLADPKSNIKTIGYAAGLIALITMIIVANNLYDKYQKETARVETNMDGAKISTIALKPGSDGQDGSPSSDQLQEPTVQNSKITEDASPKLPKSIQAELEREAKIKADAKLLAKKNAPTKAINSVAVSKKAKSIEIIVEALDQVKLHFKIDGGTKKTILLDAEAVHTIKGKLSVSLEMSDGGAVNIIHNGVDIGVPGDLGKSKTLKF